MIRITLLLLFIAVPCSLAMATFELEDPAKDLKEWQEVIYAEKGEVSGEAETTYMLCRQYEESGACVCRSKETGEKLGISPEACLELLEKKEKNGG